MPSDKKIKKAYKRLHLSRKRLTRDILGTTAAGSMSRKQLDSLVVKLAVHRNAILEQAQLESGVVALADLRRWGLIDYKNVRLPNTSRQTRFGHLQDCLMEISSLPDTILGILSVKHRQRAVVAGIILDHIMRTIRRVPMMPAPHRPARMPAFMATRKRLVPPCPTEG